MSWNVNMLGTPEKVAAALEEHGATLVGQSRAEYEAAAPHLAALVRQNFNHGPAGGAQLIVRLDASGSGYVEGGKEITMCTMVKLEYNYATVLV